MPTPTEMGGGRLSQRTSAATSDNSNWASPILGADSAGRLPQYKSWRNLCGRQHRRLILKQRLERDGARLDTGDGERSQRRFSVRGREYVIYPDNRHVLWYRQTALFGSLQGSQRQ